MKKFKTALMALVAALAVVFGGLVAAAPSQAALANWGTTVTLEGVPISNPNAWIRARNMEGVDKILHVQETARNVAKFCPPGVNYEMLVVGPAGTARQLSPGECYVPTNDGVYQAWLHLS